MPNNNESKYLDALRGLKTGDKNKDIIKIRVSPLSLDLIEDLMDKMEWSLATAINSCITHTITISEALSFSDLDGFSLGDDFQPFELDLTVKNENRIFELAKNNNLEFHERFISYVLTKSIKHFQHVLLNKDGVENGKE